MFYEFFLFKNGFALFYLANKYAPRIIGLFSYMLTLCPGSITCFTPSIAT